MWYRNKSFESFSLFLHLQYVQPDLLLCKMLLYTDLFGVVTSGHVTKMVATSFDSPLLKTLCYLQTSRRYLLTGPEALPIEFFLFPAMPFLRIFVKNRRKYKKILCLCPVRLYAETRIVSY